MNFGMLHELRPYVRHYGYPFIFISVMLENLGIPVPGEAVLIAGGISAGIGDLSLLTVVLITILAAIVGNILGYWIGSKGGRKFLERYGKYLFIREKQLKKVDEFFIKFGDITIFFARFLTGVRVVAAIFAGAAQMRWKRFIVFSSLGAVAWALTFGYLGYLCARSIHTVGRYIFRIEMSILVLVMVVIVFLWRKRIHN